MTEARFVPDQHHPVIPIMTRLAREAGIYDELLHADIQQRAAVTLIIEILDLISPNILAHPRTLPLSALTLRAYAELLETSAGLIRTVPHLAKLADQIHDREQHHRDGKRS
jgi:hypothetical protein